VYRIPDLRLTCDASCRCQTRGSAPWRHSQTAKSQRFYQAVDGGADGKKLFPARSARVLSEKFAKRVIWLFTVMPGCPRLAWNDEQTM